MWLAFHTGVLKDSPQLFILKTNGNLQYQGSAAWGGWQGRGDAPGTGSKAGWIPVLHPCSFQLQGASPCCHGALHFTEEQMPTS